MITITVECCGRKSYTKENGLEDAFPNEETAGF